MVHNKSFLDRLERKWGRYAIHNISLYLIICYAFGYILQFVNPVFLNYLSLNPQAILRGQIWRIFTWILIPPSSSNLFFILIMLYFYYSIGTSLERVWGAFRYNVYLLLGMIFTVIGSLLIFALGEMGLLGLQSLMTSPEAKTTFYILVGRMFSTYYINMSIFLAYASTFPDMQVLFMMIIPIKVKWLGIGYMALLIYDFLLGSIINKFIIGASVLNFIVFYLTSRNAIRMSPKQIKRRHEFKKEVHKATGVTKHKCAICGRTEETNPDLEFRFCSKCDGNYEYCQEHLFTHEHVKK